MKVLIICSLIFISCEAWIGMIESDKNHSSHCYTDYKNIGALELNQKKRIEGICAEAVCLEDRNIKLNGCAPMQAHPPCYVLEGDLSDPFPKCCYKIECRNNS